jgi:outer membrane receptor protein involved in Fe transport
VIPDLVQRIDFRKGPYYADLGDFSSAGGADLEYYDVLPHSIAEIVGGRYGYLRAFYASSPAVGAGHLLNALEVFHEDGPWTKPDDYRKINGVLRYSQDDGSQGFNLTAMAYAGKWNSTDQIARRALGKTFTTSLDTYDDFGRFDSLDPSDAGNSQRYGLSGEWHRADDDSATRVLAFGFYYDLDLFSDFTYFLDSPQGDQIEQTDSRWVAGLKATHTWFGHVAGRDMQNTVGLQLRSDSIHVGLFNTIDRNRVAKFDYSDSPAPTTRATTSSDQVWEPTVSPYFENRVQWTDKIRTIAGLRLDYFHVDVAANITANSGTEDAVLLSPKGSIIVGPWAQTEMYLSGGQGFHSNDGRGATEHVDPTTGAPAQPDDLLVRTYGAELGARTTYVQNLQSTLAFWWLHIGSELVFEGDAGTTAPSAPSQRYGIEFANYYRLNDWVALDGDFAFSHAEFTHDVVDHDVNLSGTHVPEAVKSVIATGISFHQPDNQGFFSELRLRYFGPRDLSVSGHPESGTTALLSASLGYNFNEHVAVGAQLFNLLDRKDHDIDYFYPSFITGVDRAPAPGAAPAV